MVADEITAHIHLTPEAPQRLRRAEDREDVEIREQVFQHWLSAFARESPHAALMAALDQYRRELTIRAVRRYGVEAMR